MEAGSAADTYGPLGAGDDRKIMGGKVSPITLDVTGNWRITNEIDGHGVRYMRAGVPEDGDTMEQEVFLGVLLGVSALVMLVLLACAMKAAKA